MACLAGVRQTSGVRGVVNSERNRRKTATRKSDTLDAKRFIRTRSGEELQVVLTGIAPNEVTRAKFRTWRFMMSLTRRPTIRSIALFIVNSKGAMILS